MRQVFAAALLTAGALVATAAAAQRFDGYVAPMDVPAVEETSTNARGVALERAGDVESALTLLLEAAAAGDAAAATNAGQLLSEISGRINHDWKRGRDLLENAAAAGDGFAMLALGRIYNYGWGVPRDLSKAVPYYRNALETVAAPEASFYLTHVLHYEHDGTPPFPQGEMCSVAESAGHRIAIAMCGDYRSGNDYVAQKHIQLDRAVSLPAWYVGLNIERHYVSTLFWDRDEQLVDFLKEHELSFRTHYGMDVPALISQLGTAGTGPADSGEADHDRQTPNPPLTPVEDTAAATIIQQVIGNKCPTGAGTMDPSGITERDVTGDGLTDLLLDHRAITCSNGDFADSCGFRACDIDFFVRGTAGLTKVYEVLSIGVSVGDGSIPAIALTGHNFDEASVRWNGIGFATTDAPAPSAADRWAYGRHPVLGLSAYLDLGGGEALGVACGYHGSEPAVSGVAALRATPGLLTQGKLTLMFDPPGAIGSHAMLSVPGEAYVEHKDTTCGVPIADLKGARELLITPAEAVGFFTDERGGTHSQFSHAGQTFSQAPGDDPRTLPAVRRFTLRGSAAAINKVITACPAMRLDIEWNCGI